MKIKILIWLILGSLLVCTEMGCSTTKQRSNAADWHSVTMTPTTNSPCIHWYNKINPVWWFGNQKEPLPPAWYEPNNPSRNMMWYFRNPLSNFCDYTIGVADKQTVRTGKYPESVGNPYGGWNFAITRWNFLFFPFIDYKNSRMEFYLGWREKGNFGIKLNFHKIPEKISKGRPH